MADADEKFCRLANSKIYNLKEISWLLEKKSNPSLNVFYHELGLFALVSNWIWNY